MFFRLVVASFLTAFFLCFLSLPYVMDLATRHNILAQPGERKIHKVPIPTIGGLSLCFGFTVSVLLYTPMPQQVFGFFGRETLGILLGGLVMTGVGFLDDWLDLKPFQKMAGQMLAFLVAWSFGIGMKYITSFDGNLVILPTMTLPGGAEFPIVSFVLTFLWTVGLSNMLNFIDGVDGLAGGVAAISALVLLLLAVDKGLHSLAYMLAALVGVSVAFLRYNFFPARVFMGDCGALFVGFTLACISVQGAMKGPTLVAFITPVVVLGIPILDGTFSVIRRLFSGKSVSVADRKHIHHRLLDRGLTQKQVALAMYGVAIFLGVVSLFISSRVPLVMYFILLLTVLYALYRVMKRVTLG